MSLREALKMAERMGMDVKHAHRKGEWIIRKLDGRYMRFSDKRHDVLQQLVTELRKYQRLLK
jgi:hemerythrin-like domain-containing protein